MTLSQENNITPDVHRNLSLAITALDELEERKTGNNSLPGKLLPEVTLVLQ